MKTLRRTTAVLLSLLLVFAAAGCAAEPEQVQAQFDAFLAEELKSALESDYLSMHILTFEPQTYGIDRESVPVNLGERDILQSKESAREELKKSIKKLKSFPRAKLTPEQQDTYDIYLFYLEAQQQLAQKKFDYLGGTFSEIGEYTQLPTMFADYRFYSERDIADLIALVWDTRDYMGGQIAFAKQQQEKGTLCMDCDAVIEYCEGIVQEGEQSAVLASMQKSIEAMGLDDGQEQEYLRQLKEAFLSSFLPAYQDIADAARELKAQGAGFKSLAEMPNGKQYYEALLQYNVGTKTSAKEFTVQLEEALEAQMGELYAVLSKEGVAERYLETGLELSTPYTDFPKMLQDLEQRISEHFPSVGKVDYTVETIAPALAVETIGAYFNIPSLDGGEPELIKVNTTSTSSSVSSLETFMTVAHEGFPGHLYQYAYMRKNLADQPLRQVATLSGYTEGYAKYIESLAAHYAGVDEDLADLYCSNALCAGYMTVLADIGIHYEGWSREQVLEFMQDYGLDEQYFEEAYHQLVNNPGIFLPYFGGQMQFAKLRAKAEQTLGADFDEIAFHDLILRYGAPSFDFLNQKLELYLQQEQRAAA